MKVLKFLIKVFFCNIIKISQVPSTLLIITLLSSPTYAQEKPSERQLLLRDIFKELIEINTTHSEGNTTQAANAMAKRLIAAGYPEEDVQILAPDPRKGNLIARLHGTGERQPLLLLAHLDVVEAKKEDWSYDPFKLHEQDGYFYGRGTVDDKAMAAILVTNFILYRQEEFIPDRDLIICLTADEEGGNFNGVNWLLNNHRQMIDSQYCLNEGGYGQIRNGKYLANEVQVGEKVYQSFRLEVVDSGGHSSVPKKDNAIYHLAEGLIRIGKFDFPVKLNEGTRVYFKRTAAIEKNDQVASDMRAVIKMPPDKDAVSRLSKIPILNALMRTTCVATMLNAGHAANALPQRATAIVNCRILPGESPDKVLQTLTDVIANDKIKVTPMNVATSSDPSPLVPEVMQAIEKVTDEIWPGLPVIPSMAPFSSDGSRLRNAGIPTYGVSGLFSDADDVRAHGKDERIRVKSLYESQIFLHKLVKLLSSEN